MRSLAMCFLVWVSACSTEETIITCPNGINPVTKACRDAPVEDVGQAVDVASLSDAGSTTGPTDTGPPPEETASEEAGPLDAGPVDGQCSITDPMDRKIGFPCTSHTQCESCYCYDEAFLSPFRFCTQDCSSGVGSDCPNAETGPAEFACVKFTVGLAQAYDLTKTSICMPRCQSVEECATYAPDYNACDSDWDNVSVQAVNTCMVK